MKKRIISLITAVVLLVSLTVSVTASGTLIEISAYQNHGINFKINGKEWTPEQPPITFDGRTYLPLRSVGEALGALITWDGTTQTVGISTGETASAEQFDIVLEFPADKYPTVAAHIASAILAGESAICTIDRSGADQRREQSLAGIPTKDGYDRDEWPMAMCAEGGEGASVAYIDPSENRGAGSWVGNQLAEYPDGTRVKFVISFREMDAKAARNDKQQSEGEVYYRSCAEAREAGVAPLRIGDPGYGRHLDRDGDGIACE
jgi:hypothetical protein